MAIRVKIDGSPSGPTPHDGRYVVSWNPNTRYGILHVVSSADAAAAKPFDSIVDAMTDWNTVSSVDPTRPDGRPNRPLSGLTITFEGIPD